MRGHIDVADLICCDRCGKFGKDADVVCWNGVREAMVVSALKVATQVQEIPMVTLSCGTPLRCRGCMALCVDTR